MGKPRTFIPPAHSELIIILDNSIPGKTLNRTFRVVRKISKEHMGIGV